MNLIFVRIKDIFLKEILEECPFLLWSKIQLEEVHRMNSTALGAENIIFISEAHEKFFHEKLKEVRYQDTYHRALVYCLGICEDTRRNVNSIYDFKSGLVKTECLHEGWQTSGSVKVVRMAFNLQKVWNKFLQQKQSVCRNEFP